MPISKVTIDSFKSINNLTLEFGQVNVFIGANGSGKSNILEALAILSCAVEGSLDYHKLAYRGSRISSPEIFKSSFKHIDRKNHFSISSDLGGIEYSLTATSSTKTKLKFKTEKIARKTNGRNHKIGGRGPHGTDINGMKGMGAELTSDQGLFPLLEAFKNFSKKETEILNDIKNYAIYSVTTPALRGISGDTSNRSPLGLYGGGLASSLKEIVLAHNRGGEFKEIQSFFKIFDWYKSIGTTEDISKELLSVHVNTIDGVPVYTDKFMKTNFNKLYAYDVSEGALYALFYIVLLMHKESPNIFAIDNVDATLNPSAARATMSNMVSMISKYQNKQIFVTTHNPSTLDAIDLFDDKNRLFVDMD